MGFNIQVKQSVRRVRAVVILHESGRPCFILFYTVDSAQATVWREEQLARRHSSFPFLVRVGRVKETLSGEYTWNLLQVLMICSPPQEPRDN